MILLFDIGATSTRLGLGDGKKLLRVVRRPTPKAPEAAVRLIAKLAKLLKSPVRITKAVGGVPRPVNLQQWRDFPFVKKLQSALRVPVTQENDTALAGLGEAVFGAGRGKRIVMYMNIGTGVNGVKIENGRIDENARGFEVGHQILSLEGKAPLCSCGGRGHLEAYVSGWSVERLHIPKKERKKALHAGIHNSVLHWSPDIVVLGGALIHHRYYDIRTLRTPDVQIKKGQLGDDAGLWGALRLSQAS